MEKVIIWDYKHHNHNNSYVHNGYYKAFKKMGYEPYPKFIRNNLDKYSHLIIEPHL